MAKRTHGHLNQLCMPGTVSEAHYAQGTGTALQVLADIEAKYRVKMAASNGRLEDAMESVTLHDGRRRPSRRSNYEILLKVCPAAIRPPDTCLCDALDMRWRTAEQLHSLSIMVGRAHTDFPCQHANLQASICLPCTWKLLYQDWLSLDVTAHSSSVQLLEPTRRPFLAHRALFPVPCQEGACHYHPEGLEHCVNMILLVAGWA